MRLNPRPVPASNLEERSEEANVPLKQSMAIDIYRSSLDRSKYLSVPSGTDLGAMIFPADTDSDLQSVSMYKPNIVIESGKVAVGLDVDDLLKQLGASGFAVHGLKFSASLSVGIGMGVSG